LLADGETDTLIELLGKRRAGAAHISDEAIVVCELAGVLEKIGRPEEGLSALLEILAKVPDSAFAHDTARGLAMRMGKADAYLDAVVAAAEKLRRADDASTLADLLLRAADVAEKDLKLLDRALAFLRRAEQTDRRGAETQSALARVAALAQDAAEIKRAVAGLRRLLQVAASESEKGDLFYRLAEAQIGQAEMREEGLDALAQAVEIRPDLPRATAIVQGAQVPDAALARVLPVYEKVARASKDEHMLLDFLERRASLSGAQLGDVREGVELAVSLGEGERAERMLARAVAIARSSGALRDGLWAVGDLSRRLRARGDMAGAARVLEEAHEEWPNPRLTPLVRETARAAAASVEFAPVAARLFDRLRILYPTDREVWEPLLELWARLGERVALQALVSDLVEKLMSRGDRSTVRMAWARFLQGSGDTGEAMSAALRDVLLEEPGHPEALALLADLLEQRGEVSEAVTLLSEALSSGEGSAAGPSRAMLARRLGDLVKKADPAQAKEVYRSALAASLPDLAVKRSLQLALAELLTAENEIAERASLCEEVLLGETGEGAAAQAVALFDLRTQISDDAGAERALMLGRERVPGHGEIFERLGRFYTQRERWSDLAQLLSQEASQQADASKAKRLLRKAARLQSEKLHDTRAAAQTLRQAAQKDPGDFELVRELCDALVEAGEPAHAVAAVGEILAQGQAGPALRIGLLRLRSELSARGHDDAAAVSDLEEAISLGASDATADLAAALSRVAGRAASGGDKPAARAATLRLAEILRASGDHEQADQVLFRWIEACPDDGEVLRQMRDIFIAAERWEAAANVWARLVHVEEGEAKAEAALALTDTLERLERSEEAIPWLSAVLAHLPGHRGLQLRLAALYASAGKIAESARLRNEMADSEPDESERFRLYVQIGQALLAVGEGADAAVALEKALALPLADRPTRALLLDAYTAAGAVERASAVLGELLTDAKTIKSEELATLYHRQSKLAAVMGDHDGQLQALKKALDADRRSVVIANELADLAESIGDDELALRALRVVAANPIKDAKVLALAYLRQARIAHRSKDRSRAIIFVKRALQENPDLEEAKALLDQLR
jgi:tetratricopeptide (TPR) repeat protein